MTFWLLLGMLGFCYFITSAYGVDFRNKASLAWAKEPPFSTCCFRIVCVFRRIGHVFKVPVWPSI